MYSWLGGINDQQMCTWLRNAFQAPTFVLFSLVKPTTMGCKTHSDAVAPCTTSFYMPNLGSNPNLRFRFRFDHPLHQTSRFRFRFRPKGIEPEPNWTLVSLIVGTNFPKISFTYYMSSTQVLHTCYKYYKAEIYQGPDDLVAQFGRTLVVRTHNYQTKSQVLWAYSQTRERWRDIYIDKGSHW